MKGGEIKIKYAIVEEGQKNGMRDNFGFILPVRASYFRSVSKTVSILEDLGRWRD
jgi:hypothetical protein